MLLRLLALLISIGMIVISTQGPAVDPTPDTAALVDFTDDVPFERVEPAVLVAPPAQITTVPKVVSQPDGYRPETFVFRPPRAALA